MTSKMRAMLLERPNTPLRAVERAIPEPAPGQVLIRVLACGVCRTDLHIVDGDLTDPKLPLIPGHEIVGEIAGLGPDVTAPTVGTRVGVPWLGHTCGVCSFCRSQRENLCDQPLFTGYTINGGYAEYCVAHTDFVFELPKGDPVAQAPLLCAGLIGYRSLTKAGQAQRLGVYGFGAAAHILAQIAVWQGREVFAFTREGDRAAQEFASRLGAVWTGASTQAPPQKLDAAIIFAPVGDLVPLALHHIKKGGTVVCGGIHMSDIPAFPYADLWEERSIVSVANLTRQDGEEFFRLAADAGVKTETTPYPLRDANQALTDLRTGRLQGAAVLVP